jgi:hypothetical protein
MKADKNNHGMLVYIVKRLFDNDFKAIQWGKRRSSTNAASKLDTHMRMNEVELLPSIIYN